MYPETDVPPVALDPAALELIAQNLPELPAVTRERLARSSGLGPQVISELEAGQLLPEFEVLVSRGHAASAVARLLTRDLDEARAGSESIRHEPTVDELDAILAALSSNRFAKEGTAKVLQKLLAEGVAPESAIAGAASEQLSSKQVEQIVEELLDQNSRLLVEKGERALSPLMGDLMARVRGRRDGQEVAAVLRRGLARRLQGRPASES
jgi:Glu-tRNA(Gln) amidotransferase subunit E-like FAD-binding protein